MIHYQAKTYGLPPHLLAQSSLEEFWFNQEVLETGTEEERQAARRASVPRTRRRR